MTDFNKSINRLGTFCTQWDYVEDRFGKSDLLPFTISDMDLESPNEISEALISRINHKVYGYSRWNHDEFKCSIVNWYKKRFNYEFDKSYVVYSPSVIYSVAKIIELFSNEGDKVLINTPAYDGFYKVIKSNNRELIENKLEVINNEYKIDIKDFEEKCREASIFLLCNPHNPTGRVWTEEELSNMVRICEENDVKIISDDIHMDITYKTTYTPVLKLSKKHEDIVICSAASKTFNIPALTGSYIVIPSNETRNKFLERLKNMDALSSPSILGVIATIKAYNECEYWLEDLLLHTKENIEYVISYLKDNIPELECYMPDGAYFAWIDFSKLRVSSEMLQDILINEGKVAIMPGKTYGNGGENYLRLNVACSREKLDDGLKRLKKSVENIKINRR